jgi:aminoglycoside phosphotransferase (APT) family kinase protein
VAIAEAGTPADAGPAVFTHRDFHPGNVLWSRGRVTGVVDWPTASVGPAVVDVGHCRTNLVQLGLDVVDDLAARWERLSGATFHPWADVTAIVGMLDGLVAAPPPGAEALDALVARAVASLTG